jgi:hypothetical protein
MDRGTSSSVTPPGKDRPLPQMARLFQTLYLRSGYGHDKSQAILPYRKLTNRPLLFFFGDGVSGTFSFYFRLPAAIHQPPTILCHTPIDMRAFQTFLPPNMQTCYS